MPNFNQQIKLLTRRTNEVIPEDGLLEKLKMSASEGRPLRVKLGCDPSRPDLHIGHAVVLRKLRDFQDLGHQAILVVGDFTGMIGDPSGRNETRPQLTRRETIENGKTYFEQAVKILDPEKTHIVYNSDWLGTMNFEDVIRLASNYTVARMLERDDFEKRYKAEEPINIHEFLYPLAQAMDSVALEADVELGGTDQKFNLLVGRDIQRAYGQEPQIIMTMPILEGTDGVRKMSKSYDNYIGLTDQPADMFGKVMSIPDDLITRYFEFAAFASQSDIERVKETLKDGNVNPMDLKKELGERIVEIYHSKAAAEDARKEFDRVFSKGKTPDDIDEVKYPRGKEIWIVDLLRENKLASGGGDARRLIKQGAVSIDGEKIQDMKLQYKIENSVVIKVGKRRFLKIIPID